MFIKKKFIKKRFSGKVSQVMFTKIMLKGFVGIKDHLRGPRMGSHKACYDA
jgi:hypothetical protein